MANENDTTSFTGANGAVLIAPEGTVVSESFRIGDVITLAQPAQTGFSVRFIEAWTPQPLTPAEVEAHRVAERVYQERRQAIERWAKRSFSLLKSMLSPQQQTMFQVSHCFDCIGSQTGKTYRIHWGHQGNVRLIEDGNETVSYCAQPPDVSVAEILLAQKLQIECDEPAFLAIANATCMATGDRVGPGGPYPSLREFLGLRPR